MEYTTKLAAPPPAELTLVLTSAEAYFLAFAIIGGIRWREFAEKFTIYSELTVDQGVDLFSDLYDALMAARNAK